MTVCKLEGRRIIITGGASGMGEGLVRALPRLDAKVVSMDLNAGAGTEIVRQSAAIGFVQVDVSDPVSVTAGINHAVELLGGLDVLIHAAGIAPASPASETSPELWNHVMQINELTPQSWTVRLG